MWEQYLKWLLVISLKVSSKSGFIWNLRHNMQQCHQDPWFVNLFCAVYVKRAYLFWLFSSLSKTRSPSNRFTSFFFIIKLLGVQNLNDFFLQMWNANQSKISLSEELCLFWPPGFDGMIQNSSSLRVVLIILFTCSLPLPLFSQPLMAETDR